MSSVPQILSSKWYDFRMHTFQHDLACKQFAIEASEKLWITIDQIFKTLIVQWWDIFYCCILPWGFELDCKKIAKIVWAKKISFPKEEIVSKVTGYNFGWVSPIGQKKQLQTFLDKDCNNFKTLFISAWAHWEEIQISPKDLQQITKAEILDIKRT